MAYVRLSVTRKSRPGPKMRLARIAAVQMSEPSRRTTWSATPP
jgi:hypothetical protein